MKNFSKIIIISFFYLTSFSNYLTAEEIYFIDYSKILNTSIAGIDAQKKLKEKFEKESKKFQNEDEKIKKDEAEIISQKKILSNEDYEKKVSDLRNKAAILQRNKQDSLNAIAKSRSDAKQILLKSINPILERYMKENKIKLVLDKQGIVLGDTSLELTDKIIEIVNKELTSIKLN